MKTETAPANASRDRAVRVSMRRACTRSDKSSTKLWSASTRWLRRADSTSEPTPNDLRRFHISFPFLAFVCSPYTDVQAKTLRRVGMNAATLGSWLLAVALAAIGGTLICRWCMRELSGKAIQRTTCD